MSICAAGELEQKYSPIEKTSPQKYLPYEFQSVGRIYAELKNVGAEGCNENTGVSALADCWPLNE